MNIEIRKLEPDLTEDYIHFFDNTPHDEPHDDDNVDEHKCYCVCWCNEDCTGDYERKYLSSREKRRNYAKQCIQQGSIKGYLAYYGGAVVGWCNANTKSDCLRCYSWRRFMDYVPIDDIEYGIKVKSIFCFVIAPEMRRKGIATRLMERVCKDAAQDGFDAVEAYPYKVSGIHSDFGGPFEMYQKEGFVVSLETKQGFVMRKQLK